MEKQGRCAYAYISGEERSNRKDKSARKISQQEGSESREEGTVGKITSREDRTVGKMSQLERWVSKEVAPLEKRDCREDGTARKIVQQGRWASRKMGQQRRWGTAGKMGQQGS
jgi:hypothetical protein